nr:hypothetical protein [Tanacetum cinerariifolium]
IINGNSPVPDPPAVGTVVPPKTEAQKLAKKNKLKAKSTLLLAIPDEHLLKFHSIKDAKSLREAIKARFRGNKESKKMHKTIMKQQYENFVASRTEGLDKTYDRFQKLISQLEVNDNKDLEQIDTDDLEEMDLKCQVAMITMRVKRFMKKTGRNINFNGKELVGFDKTRVDCYNRHRRGYFVRECRALRNQGNRSGDNERRIVPVETPASSLVTQQIHQISRLSSQLSENEMPKCEIFKAASDSSVSEINEDTNQAKDSKTRACVNENESIASKSSEEIREEPKTVRSSASIIEDWESNSEDECVDKSSTEQDKYSNDNSVKSIEFATKSGQVLVNAAKQNSVASTSTARPKGNSQYTLQDQGIFDSGCSRHMTGNKSFLTEYQEIDGGFVAFGGSPKGGKITGKGRINTGKLDFEDVYFVKELKFNFFYVSQMCVKKTNVLFIETECLVLSSDFKLLDESQVLPKTVVANSTTEAEYVAASCCCRQQSWTTVDDEVRIQVLVDGKRVNIKESSIRHTLRLDDAEVPKPHHGISSAALWHLPSFVLLPIRNLISQGDMTHHKDIFATPSLTKKVSANMKRVDIDADVEINLEKAQAEAYNLDLDHQEKVLSMLDVNDKEPADVEEVLEVVKATKLITEVVTTAGVDVMLLVFKILQLLLLKQLKQAQIELDEEVARQLEAELNANVDWSAVIEQVQRREKLTDAVMKYQALKRKPLTEAQAKMNMIVYLKNMEAGYKMDYFKGMSYDEIIPLFEKHYNYNQAFLNEVNEGVKVPEKEQKMEQKTEELKKDLQIVPNDDDDVYTYATPLALKIPIIDYKIYTERNRPYFKIIRANGNHMLFLSFSIMLKNFDREDLESLWNIVRERFTKTEPKNYSNDYLLNTLKIMFETPNVEANVWKDQKGKYGFEGVAIDGILLALSDTETLEALFAATVPELAPPSPPSSSLAIIMFKQGKENEVNILKSIDEGPFQMGTLRETLTEGTEGALHLGPKQTRVYSDLTSKEKDRVVVQNVHSRQNRGNGNNARGAGATGYGGAQNRVGYANPGRQDNAVDEDVDEQPVQDLELNVDNMFLADDYDAFNFNVDEAPTTQTLFMANLSFADPVYDESRPSYDSDVLSEVHDHDHYQDAVCEHHEVHKMNDDVQPNYVIDSHTDYTSDSNTTLYDQIVITDRNIKEENLKKELHSVKMKLASTINHNKLMVEEVTSLKKNFKQKENKYLEEFLDMKALKEKVEDKLFKQDQSLQTVHMLCKPKPYYDEQRKAAIGYKSPLCLTRAKQVQPAPYNGHEIIKTDHVLAIVHNSKDTLEIAEITRKKMDEKMKTPLWTHHKINIRPLDYSKENFLATFTPQTQLTPEHIFLSKDVLKMKTEALKEQAKATKPIKALMVYPPNTPVKLVPRKTALLTENENLNVQIKAKLKCVTIDYVTPKVLAPVMYAIDVELIPRHLRNNKEAHLDYLKHLKESVTTLREIVKEAKVERPLDRSVASACLYTKHS